MGTRNFIRVGDRVRFTTPGKWPTEAVVRRIVADDDGRVTEVDVIVCRQTLKGRAQSAAGRSRTLRPERIERVAQTRDGRRREPA